MEGRITPLRAITATDIRNIVTELHDALFAEEPRSAREAHFRNHLADRIPDWVDEQFRLWGKGK